jgi:hypothetical protein
MGLLSGDHTRPVFIYVSGIEIGFRVNSSNAVRFRLISDTSSPSIQPLGYRRLDGDADAWLSRIVHLEKSGVGESSCVEICLILSEGQHVEWVKKYALGYISSMRRSLS